MDIGGELGISEITVIAHRGKVMQKMKADSMGKSNYKLPVDTLR
jgi:FixJ family two-component response regulator